MIRRVLVYVFFFIASLILVNPNTTYADVSTICCGNGQTPGDTCSLGSFPTPTGTCRDIQGSYEVAACGAYTPPRLVCDDRCCDPALNGADCHPDPGETGHCTLHGSIGECPLNWSNRVCSYTVNPTPTPNPGTYYCNNCQHDPMTGEWRCYILQPDNCGDGYIPNCSACAPSGVYTNPCAPNTSCNLPCIAGQAGGNGADCNCNEECQDGYVCNEAGHCQPEGYYYECCDPANNGTDCPPRVGYTPVCDIPNGNCAAGYQCSWQWNRPQYSCHWLESGYGSCLLDPGGDTQCTDIGCTSNCDQWDASNCGEFHDCICPTPTPDDAIPTIVYEQCGNFCDNPEFPYGNCASSRPSYGCERPTDEDGDGLDDDGSRDCTISGIAYDCWCCNQPMSNITPRPPVNPLCSDGFINTAIGCIPLGDKNSLLVFILRWAIGIAGGVSFLLIIYSGFVIMTAGGDKRKVQVGRELLTAAISGMMLIIFSVFILDLIGIRILRIPGLG